MANLKRQRLLERALSRPGLRKALSQTLLGSLASQVTLVVSGVAVARTLGPVDRGHLALLTVASAVAWQLGAMGIPHALAYSIARSPHLAQDIIRTVARSLRPQFVVATLVCAAFLTAVTVHRPGYVRWGALLTVAATAPSLAQLFGLGVLQGARRFAEFNWMRVAPSGLFATLAAAILVSGRGGFLAVAVAWVISQVVFVPWTLNRAWKAAKEAEPGPGQAPSVSWIRQFGRRSMFGAAPPIETYRLDQSVVALFLPPAALGYYVVALAFTNFPRFVANSFGMVASPMVAAKQTHAQATRAMWRFLWLAVPFYLGVAGVLWLLAPKLTTFFFGEEFEQSASLTRILLVATVLFCTRRVLTDAARGAGFLGLGSAAEVIGLVVVIPLFAVFLPIWGATGVAYALVISSALALAVLVVGLARSTRQGVVPSAWLTSKTVGDDELEPGTPIGPTGV